MNEMKKMDLFLVFNKNYYIYLRMWNKQYLKVSQSNPNMTICMGDKDEAIVQDPIYSPFKTDNMKKQFRWALAGLLFCMFLFTSVTHVEASNTDPTSFGYALNAANIQNDVNLEFDAVTVFTTITLFYGFSWTYSTTLAPPEARCNGPT